MAITEKSRHVVIPAKPTWNGMFPLTELDQTGFVTHTPIIYIYNKPSTFLLEPSYNKNKILESLKDSLSRILVPYYPLAGRLHWAGQGGRLELECNAMGAELIEVRSTKRVSDFGDFSSSYQTMFEGLAPDVDYTTPIHELPILLVQLTWFKCGGLGLCIAISHVIADGQALFHFFKEWAKFARGDDSLASPPYLDRRILQDIRVVDNYQHEVDHHTRLPTLLEAYNDLKERTKETLSQSLILTKDQVNTLKNLANNNVVNEGSNQRIPYTRFEVVASHIWRCLCKARGLDNNQMSALCFLVDSRSRLNPPLPPRYLGDAILIVTECSQVGELNSTPLSHICQKIREKKNEMSEDYVASTITFFREQNSLYKYQERAVYGGPQGVFFGNPNVLVTSWLNLPIRGLDFGWGEEIYMGTATQQFDGDIIILPGYENDGSVVVSVGLQVEHMEEFEKYFYESILNDQHI